MTRAVPEAGVPCGVCGQRIEEWVDPGLGNWRARPCCHSLREIHEARMDALALGEGLPLGAPIQRRPAPRDPGETGT